MNAVVNRDSHRVYLGLGSNISPEINLIKAIFLLKTRLQVAAVSTAWESPPFGSQGPNFINAVALIQTELTRAELKRRILRPIEDQLGRVRTADQNAPRTIDLDILIYDEYVVDSKIFDHPYLALPLAEIIPEYKQPGSDKTLVDIAQTLSINSQIIPREDVLKFTRFSTLT